MGSNCTFKPINTQIMSLSQLFNLFSVQCAVFSDEGSVYSVRAVCSFKCAVFSVQFVVSSVQCLGCSVQFPVFIVQYSICSD